MKLRYKLLLIAVFALIALQGIAQIHQSISPDTKNIIDSTYSALIKEHKIVGASIAIVDNGRIVYSSGFGYQDAESGKQATDSTIYRIGSATKSFTALSVMQLHQQSLLDIYQPLQRYLPEFRMKSAVTNKNQKIIIKDVMHHTAGLPCDILNGFFATSPPAQDWTIRQLNKQYTIAPAGHLMAYSNAGYALLGELIARTSGLTYEQYLSKHIFEPLKMNSTAVYVSGTNSKLSRAYIKGRAFDEPFIRDAAAGLIHSNVLDMSNYILMYLNRGRFNNTEVLHESLIDSMQINYLAELILPANMKYGDGLFIHNMIIKDQESRDSRPVQYIGHGGSTLGFHSDFGFIPEQGVGAVILTNTDKGRKITDASRLLRLYLKNEKAIDLVRDAENADVERGHQPEANTDIKGVYATMLGLIHVKDEDKIKLKQGPAKIVLKRENVEDAYTAKAWLLGFIPFKVKDQEFYFQNISGQTYFTLRKPSMQQEKLVGIMAEPESPPESWKNATGEYKVTGELFDVPEDFPFQTGENKAELAIENGFVIFTLHTSVRDMKASFPLRIINDTDAIGYTYGRNTGYTVLLLPDNKLYFSGFVFQKIE